MADNDTYDNYIDAPGVDCSDSSMADNDQNHLNQRTSIPHSSDSSMADNDHNPDIPLNIPQHCSDSSMADNDAGRSLRAA